MQITLYKSGDIPIPPPFYGGCERIVYWLGKALIALGHQVTLIANAQSHIPGAELRIAPDARTDQSAWLKLVPDSTDIVQVFNTQPPTELRKPFLVRVGGNGQPGELFHPNTVFISQKHASLHGSRHFIHNGLDPAEYSVSEKRGDYAIFLAKAHWSVKNLSGARDIARRAGVELRVLGSRTWPLQMQRLIPSFRGIRYYGMVGGDEKRELLSKARCLIFPVRWHEPFGIAAIEALASGAYVAATPYGSLTEIVTPETGVLSARADDFVTAVQNPQRFKPQACRERILQAGFTHLDMARKFLKYYERILTEGSLLKEGELPPATQPGFVAKHLLPWKN